MIVYASSFDVSRPDGPGVNEQQFILSMARLHGDAIQFLIPKPRGPLPDGFPRSRCRYLPEIRGRNPYYWFRHQLGKVRAMRAIARKSPVELFIIRPDVLPLAEWLFASGRHAPYCTKNAHLSAKPRLSATGLRGLLFRVHYAALERVFRGAVMIDVVSEIQRGDLLRILQLPPERVTVTDNAVDSGLFRPMEKAGCRAALGLEEVNPLFGYVGNLAAERGATELILALPELVQRFPGAGALIVEGDQRSTEALRALAANVGVGDRVNFRGPVPLEQVAAHIAAMDVAVSFRDDDGCSELKVRQYIACGRPVVVSAEVNRFVVREDLGSLVDRRNTTAISAALAFWAGEVMVPERGREIAERLSNYARENLDTDRTNRLRVAAWLGAARA